MMALSLLDRYIARSIVTATAIVLAILTALFVLIGVVDELTDYGKGQYGFTELVRFVVLSLPRKLYELFPVAVLLGTLIGLSALALNAELTAMRAAGLSVWRIIAAALKIGLAIILVGVLLGEGLVPRADSAAQIGRAAALASAVHQRDSGIWLRDGDRFVNLREVLPDLSLLNLSIYEFSPPNELRRELSASRARYKHRRWRLEDVSETVISSAGIEANRYDALEWSTRLKPDVVSIFAVKPESLSLAQLRRYISHLLRNNQDPARYELVFWQKLLMPVASAVMIVLVAPFAFRHARAGGVAQRIFLGVAAGLVFVVLNRSAGHLGVLYGFPPLSSAAAPILIFSAAAYWALRRTR